MRRDADHDRAVLIVGIVIAVLWYVQYRGGGAPRMATRATFGLKFSPALCSGEIDRDEYLQKRTISSTIRLVPGSGHPPATLGAALEPPSPPR